MEKKVNVERGTVFKTLQLTPNEYYWQRSAFFNAIIAVIRIEAKEA